MSTHFSECPYCGFEVEIYDGEPGSAAAYAGFHSDYLGAPNEIATPEKDWCDHLNGLDREGEPDWRNEGPPVKIEEPPVEDQVYRDPDQGWQPDSLRWD